MFQRFFYTSSLKVQAPLISGLYSTYGAGGFVANLAYNKADTSKILTYLQTNNWIDRSTRAIFVDFTTYNANINLFCQIRYVNYN